MQFANDEIDTRKCLTFTGQYQLPLIRSATQMEDNFHFSHLTNTLPGVNLNFALSGVHWRFPGVPTLPKLTLEQALPSYLEMFYSSPSHRDSMRALGREFILFIRPRRSKPNHTGKQTGRSRIDEYFTTIETGGVTPVLYSLVRPD